MPQFKKGDVVVCINKDGWIKYPSGEDSLYGPALGEVTTVEGYDGSTFVCFEEYPSLDGEPESFSEHCFVKLIMPKEFNKELAEIIQPQTL